MHIRAVEADAVDALSGHSVGCAIMPAKGAAQAEYMRRYRAGQRARQAVAASSMSLFDDEHDRASVATFEAPVSTGTPAQQLVEWAESTLVVPDGLLRGQPFRIDQWQREFLEAALGEGIREAGLSVARKNGKSGLIAVLLLGFLIGPLHRPRWRGVVTAMTGDLAKELRTAIMATAEISGLLGHLQERVSPTPGRIIGPAGTRLDLLAADKATGHGIGADLAVIDEAGLMAENQRNLFNAMLSCVSGRDGRTVCISIQGDGPMFRELGERADDPAVVWHCYQPDARAALDDEEAWHAGNPGLRSGIKSLQYMRDMSRRALAAPSNAATFRAYDLNLPQDPSREVIVMPDQWDRCVVAEPPERDGECVVGIDLGGSTSMTAAAAVWPATGRMEVWAAFPSEPSLRERGASDGVQNLYVTMAEAGELRTWPGLVTPVPEFLLEVQDRLSGENILEVGADRYRRAEAMQAMADAGISWPMVWRGQGASATADGSHDVRAFQRAVLSGWLRCPHSMLMIQAIASSAVVRDPRGNPALDKSRSRGRIDALSAAVIAAGLAERIRSAPRRSYERAIA